MRTLNEIAEDLAKARQASYWQGMRNVYGKTPEQMAEIMAQGMELDRQIFRLEQEKKEWVES